MSAPHPPPPLGDKWKSWAESMNSFLVKSMDRLRFKTSEDSAAEDGILMWDAEEECPVVSKDGAWIKIQLDP
jgi:hypothetical protein|tara:strand:+ start:1024 stop:1239 length:216 start_codon:yes stop_codon:yes gene_type:complete